MTSATLVCSRCGAQEQSLAAWRCSCNGPFVLAPSTASPVDAASSPLQRMVREGQHGVWRYQTHMRLPCAVKPLTLGEGSTPLIASSWSTAEARLHFKLDYLLPSGSFKDRGAAVMLAVAASNGIERIVCDSSGNAGAAIAAYAAKAGMACDVFVSKNTSPAKLGQIAAYGANVVRVDGDRDAAADAAQEAALTTFYASHAWNPFFLEGTKTSSYEIWEQLEGRAPDHVCIPVGHGTLFLGVLQGFEDLLRHAQIPRLPRLHAVQSESCAPIEAASPPHARVGAGSRGSDVHSTTIAEGIRVRQPVRLKAIVDGLVRSRGASVSVSDVAIEKARHSAARQGLFIEPTAAVALAGFERLAESGTIRKGETVVVPLTGHGLKTLHHQE